MVLLSHAKFAFRAFARNMDIEAVEHSIQEATAAVHESISSIENSLLNLEEHTRYSEEVVLPRFGPYLNCSRLLRFEKSHPVSIQAGSFLWLRMCQLPPI